MLSLSRSSSTSPPPIQRGRNELTFSTNTSSDSSLDGNGVTLVGEPSILDQIADGKTIINEEVPNYKYKISSTTTLSHISSVSQDKKVDDSSVNQMGKYREDNIIKSSISTSTDISIKSNRSNSLITQTEPLVDELDSKITLVSCEEGKSAKAKEAKIIHTKLEDTFEFEKFVQLEKTRNAEADENRTCEPSNVLKKNNITNSQPILTVKKNQTGVSHHSLPNAPFSSSPNDSSGSSGPSDDEWLNAFGDVKYVPIPKEPFNDPRRKGNFWTDVKEVEGDDYLGGIDMAGLLGKKMHSVDNPKGKFYVRASTEHGGYVLKICEKNNADVSIAKVYWLPWSSVHDNGGTEYIEIDELKASGCEFFMTSNLSGCRFVATNKYLAHFSCAQKISDKAIEDTEGRASAEQKLNENKNFQPTKRLALSISDISESQSSPEVWRGGHYSYRRNDKGSGIAFVIGIKKNDDWVIKYLKTSDRGPIYGGGTWYTMDYGTKQA